MPKVPNENIEAESLANWLKASNYKFTHIANESWLPPKVAMLSAMRKKRMWLSPWFPDFCIVLKRNSLLFIELKRQKPVSKTWKVLKSPSIISPEQILWIDTLNNIQNVEAHICYWFEEAKNLINIIELNLTI